MRDLTPARRAVTEATGQNHFRVAVVLGSGLSSLAASLAGGEPIPYSGIPGMPVSTVQGHEGALYAGGIGGASTLAFAGRVHLYEGRSEAEVTFAVRLAAELGCEVAVLTNAAGGINRDLPVGAPSLISDHLNLTGTNPLIGPNDDAVGPRFLDLTEVYDAGLRTLAGSVDPELRAGVYAGLVGPTYETPAEVRMLGTMGADLVGMSTVLEAIVARYLGVRVLGISVVTNPAAGLTPEPLSHEEVAAASRRAADRLESLLRGMLERL
ncbi:MAG: purine-nucleoside phosphorylase [Actinomycetota bacterium]|nr:purine-nucleoside phosphorylase [Actinomycetota bacterium]